MSHYSGNDLDHACHTAKDTSGKNYAAGSLYIQNIRTGLISLSKDLPAFDPAIKDASSLYL